MLQKRGVERGSLLLQLRTEFMVSGSRRCRADCRVAARYSSWQAAE